ncbi:MAG TPA: hypothetical protein VFD26_04210 [Methyloceanibacter sp.]|nr:hypothetical protein [Methyloceanibacter sp.]
MALTAEAFDLHVPKGFIYAAMVFSLAVEALNIRAPRSAEGCGSSAFLVQAKVLHDGVEAPRPHDA